VHGGLDKYLDRPRKSKVKIEDGSNILQVYKEIGLEKSVAHVVLQNGEKVDLEQKVESEAEIDIYPIFGGG